MSDQYGACVVLVPAYTGLPISDKLVGGPHITLAYLGDEALESVLEVELLQHISHISDSLRGPIRLKTAGYERFGEDEDAVVLTFDPHPESAAVLIRERLLEMFSNELTDRFRRAETFPEYRPHMTLGYVSDGFDPELINTADTPEWVHIDHIAVWNGNARTQLHFINSEDLMQYGIKRKSGRYPWGSGENPYQRSVSFYNAYNQLKAEGLTDTQIATAFGEMATPKDPSFNTTMLRATRSMAKDHKIAGERALFMRMRAKGMSVNGIARATGIPEPTVRNRLKDSVDERVNATNVIANKLKDAVSETSYIDIGRGNANRLGISDERLKTAVAMLQAEGYEVMHYKESQLGVPGNETSIKLLVPPGTKGNVRLADHRERIRVLDAHSKDNGLTFEPKTAPKNLSSKRLQINYAEDGGADKDGTIELRRGVKDLDLGANRYAQVRIAVDGTHYLKGMAHYADDLPDGIDVRFNTNKTREEAPNLKALKPLKETYENSGVIDLDAPFGAQIKPGGQQGVLNLVNEEGDWDSWSRKLSSQFLSKQPESLARQQLNLSRDLKQAELDEIKSLTNPTVKQKLLESYADGADSQAVTLKAMHLPRTSNKVILPVPSMKETEVYAPTYRDGERVVLVRHPHGGRFEIPELTVNNRSRNAKSIMGDAVDAIGINPAVAERLSGADFDGDTVLVIPQKGQLKNSDPLKGLANFNPRQEYKETPGMKYMTKKNTQNEMGRISNLITDMTLRGADIEDPATNSEIARAIRHSMVVIDAEKHKLNYKLSEEHNGIQQLRDKYQDGGGASTLISRAKSDERIPERRLARVSEGGPIDPETGEKRYVPTGRTKQDGSRDPKTKEWKPRMVRDPNTGELVPKMVDRQTLTTKMAATKDARTLMSSRTGTPMERIYADYANQMKGLANEARREMLNTPNLKRSPTAAKTYAPQVASLVESLNRALKNAPLERQAQIVGNAILRAKLEANPDMDRDDIKKVRARALNEARLRTGANKALINISPIEWEAIQAGAISHSRLAQILNHADLDRVKELATPRTSRGIAPGVIARAQAMRRAGATWDEIASHLGVSVSTLTREVGK